MRLYLPATLDEITRADDELTARGAHAVTPELRAAAPDEDEEGLERIAQLAAADESLELLARAPDAPRLRTVVAADVPDSFVVGSNDGRATVTSVRLTVAVRVGDVACLLVDEPSAAPDVTAALSGDAGALDLLDERDLLWYDVSEVGRVPRD